MKKLAIAGALMLLAGCAEVENYNNVVKTPAPDWLAGYWQTKGPQRALVSPEAIGSLIVTKEGDTLDCRQWQRVIAVPGKLTLMPRRRAHLNHRLREWRSYACCRHGCLCRQPHSHSLPQVHQLS